MEKKYLNTSILNPQAAWPFPKQPPKVESITLEEQTLVKIAGIPFSLAAGTVIEGTRENYELARRIEREMNLPPDCSPA